MKYEIIDNVSRFVKRLGMIEDIATVEKAVEEANDYDWRRISDNHYAVQHKDKLYVIIERDGLIGCSCEDMTFNRKDGSVCKHIITFSRRMSPPSKPIDDADKAFLVNMGWTGAELHPEDVQIPPDDAVAQDEGVQLQIRSKCQYCKMGHIAGSQADADKWVDVHEGLCPQNPANQTTTEPEPDDPGSEPEPKTTALSTAGGFPDEREFTNRRVENYMQNRGGFYKTAGGAEVPDSAAMSIYALNTCRISTETILIEKDADQAKAIVRGHKGDVAVDASVILRFDVLRRRELLKMAKKYPKAILEWTERMMPVMDLNFRLTDKTPVITLGEHMINFAIDQEQFSERTAETLARRRVFDMLSGVDWRDAVETAVERDDSATVESSKR